MKLLLGSNRITTLQVGPPEHYAGAGICGARLKLLKTEHNGVVASPLLSIAISRPRDTGRRALDGLRICLTSWHAIGPALPPYDDLLAKTSALRSSRRSEIGATVTWPTPFVQNKSIMLFFIFLS